MDWRAIDRRFTIIELLHVIAVASLMHRNYCFRHDSLSSKKRIFCVEASIIAIQQEIYDDNKVSTLLQSSQSLLLATTLRVPLTEDVLQINENPQHLHSVVAPPPLFFSMPKKPHQQVVWKMLIELMIWCYIQSKLSALFSPYTSSSIMVVWKTTSTIALWARLNQWYYNIVANKRSGGYSLCW